ncbi:methyl-CpG-binding domain-containing protein 11-like isoform X3 [Iris pallida]|uniref:Methyl-CpG-binding domain-containing protein 11-like isoform X3 n=1 Tax=Iris pallida TaxID=29817 RepID=A0AAX6FS31_IRIPA|nr:methyl-CpG-binding domain-containing protein 11-like isoform X3 [Iris pallida]
MASSNDAATPAKGHGADTEVVSLDLPAPTGWTKKFTPRKGVTPKRNEIVFTSPTGEEITNKRQLDQYLRSHPGGPPSSEFDWGTGDTPRRSARLGAKNKATETPEDEKPKKKERKSSSKKSLKDKSGDTANEAPEEEKDAAATKESADLEMTDAEEHGKKTEEDAAVMVDQGETEKKTEDNTVEDIEGKPEEFNREGPEEAGKPDTLLPEAGSEAKEVGAKEDSDYLPPVTEASGDGNAEKRSEDSGMLRPSEEKENDKGNNEHAEDSVVLPQTSEVQKEEAIAEKDVKDGVVLPKNDSHIGDQDGTASKEVPKINCEDGQHQPKASAVNC